MYPLGMHTLEEETLYRVFDGDTMNVHRVTRGKSLVLDYAIRIAEGVSQIQGIKGPGVPEFIAVSVTESFIDVTKARPVARPTNPIPFIVPAFKLESIAGYSETSPLKKIRALGGDPALQEAIFAEEQRLQAILKADQYGQCKVMVEGTEKIWDGVTVSYQYFTPNLRGTEQMVQAMRDTQVLLTTNRI